MVYREKGEESQKKKYIEKRINTRFISCLYTAWSTTYIVIWEMVIYGHPSSLLLDDARTNLSEHDFFGNSLSSHVRVITAAVLKLVREDAQI